MKSWGKGLLAAGIAVAVVAVLGGAAALWWRWDTARQPHVAAVTADMNTAVADVVTAAGSGAVVAVSPVVESTACKLGLHHGGMFSARADLYTDPGSENTLITGIAQRLPTRYAATLGPAVAGVSSLRAALGKSVTVQVSRLSPGWIGVVARSACSLGTVTSLPPAGASSSSAALTQLFTALGTRPATITDQRIHCASGGDIDTVAAISETVDSGSLATRLAAIVPAGAHRIAAGDSNRVAYRDGDISVVIAASDSGTAVTARYTTAC